VKQELPDLKVKQELLVFKVKQELPDLKVKQELLVLKAKQEFPVLKALRVYKVSPEMMVME
jgi:hypothetical protein